MLLIDSKTEVVTTDPISLYQEKLPVTFACVGLSSGEEIEIEFKVNDVWEKLYVAGSKSTISWIDKVKVLYSPLTIRFIKPLTLNPVSLTMYQVNIESK